MWTNNCAQTEPQCVYAKFAGNLSWLQCCAACTISLSIAVQVVVPQGVLTRASAELTINEASAIADNTLEVSCRAILWALNVPEVLRASAGEAHSSTARPGMLCIAWRVCKVPIPAARLFRVPLCAACSCWCMCAGAQPSRPLSAHLLSCAPG
jgi:hypothetical protein